MLLVLNIIWFSTLVSVFFALLAARRGQRLKTGLIIWGAMVFGSLVLALAMAPLT